LNVYGAIRVGARPFDGMQHRRAAEGRGEHALSRRRIATAIANALAVTVSGGRWWSNAQLGQPGGVGWRGGRDNASRPRASPDTHVDVVDERFAHPRVLPEQWI